MKEVPRVYFRKFCDYHDGFLYIKEKDYKFTLIQPCMFFNLSDLLAPVEIKNIFYEYKDKNFIGITVKNKFRKIDVAIKKKSNESIFDSFLKEPIL